MGVHNGATWRMRLNDACVAAMQPYMELPWPLVSSGTCWLTFPLVTAECDVMHIRLLVIVSNCCVCATVWNRGATRKSNAGPNMSICSPRTSSSFLSMRSMYLAFISLQFVCTLCHIIFWLVHRDGTALSMKFSILPGNYWNPYNTSCPDRGATILLSLTLLNANWLLKFFHWQTWQWICNLAVVTISNSDHLLWRLLNSPPRDYILSIWLMRF